MRWEITIDPLGVKQLTVQWTEQELVHLDLTVFDLAFLNECDRSPALADKLLALSVLARKCEQQKVTA